MDMLFVWNAIVFFVYGYDKSQSKKRRRRVSEKMLIFCAALLGGIGAFMGMLVFRHKTRKWKFRIFIPVFAIIDILVLIYIMR